MPRFGATEENIADNIVMLDPEPDEIDKNVERLLGSAPVQKKTKSKRELAAEEAKKDDEPKSPEPTGD